MSRVLAIAVVAALVAVPAAAQPRTGAVIGGTASVLSMDSDGHAAISGSIGYKLNSALSFGIELTGVPDLDPDPAIPVPLLAPYFPIFYGEAEGSATIFTTNVRIDIPTTNRRIMPFVVGGGGVANIEESFSVSFRSSTSVPPSFLAEFAALGLSPTVLSTILAPSFPFRSSSTGLALTIGGGASIMATDRFSIDVDLRYLRIDAETDRDAGRFGAGVSYRF